MEKLIDMEKKLKDIACPICFHGNLGLSLQCSSVGRECLIVADCGHCRHRFKMTDTSRSINQTYQDVESNLSHSNCPSCKNSGGQLRFECDLATKDCFFLAECNVCRHFYKINDPSMSQ